MSTIKIRICCGIVFAFIYSAFLAYGELSYAIRGQDCPSTPARYPPWRDTARKARHLFHRATWRQTETDIVKVDGPVPKEGMITIQYIPGDTDYSRILGHQDMGGVYFFLGCLVVLVVFIGRLECEAAHRLPQQR